MLAAQILVYLFFLYLFAGGLFALWFVTRGVERLDEGMRHVRWPVRLLIFPGAVALFPLLWRKWRKAGKG